MDWTRVVFAGVLLLAQTANAQSNSGSLSLVIDTIGFNAQGWNGVYPRTDMMRLEERYTRTDYGHLDVRVTIADPGVFTKPWVQQQRFDLAPQEELIEFVCENNKWARDVAQ